MLPPQKRSSCASNPANNLHSATANYHRPLIIPCAWNLFQNCGSAVKLRKTSKASSSTASPAATIWCSCTYAISCT